MGSFKLGPVGLGFSKRPLAYNKVEFQWYLGEEISLRVEPERWKSPQQRVVLNRWKNAASGKNQAQISRPPETHEQPAGLDFIDNGPQVSVHCFRVLQGVLASSLKERLRAVGHRDNREQDRETAAKS